MYPKHSFKVLTIAVSFLVVASAFGQSEKGKVLFLNSYNLGYDWTDLITEGVFSVFNDQPELEVYAEFLDAKRFVSPTVSKQFMETLKTKYADYEFQAILCSDNASLDLVLKFREDKMFKGVPLIFCGITNTDDYKDNALLYGVKEEHEFEELVEAIHGISPQVKTLNVVLDNSATGRSYRDMFLEFQSRWSDTLEFVFHFDHSFETLEATFGNLDKEHAIYSTLVTIDEDGEPMNGADYLAALIKQSPVPVFGDLLADGSKGMIGGQTNNAKVQGAMSAELVVDLLEGRRIPVQVIDPDSVWRFDYEVIERFRLDLESFPKDALIDNLPDDVFELYKREIIATGVLLFLLSSTVFLLSALLIQKRQHEKELLAEKERAEESDRLKSVFLANISHEIRTPLNAMIGFANLLQYDENLDDSARESTELIVDSGFSLRDTISNILEYSRIESGEKKIEAKVYPFSEALEWLWSFEHLATVDKGRIVLKNEIPDDFQCSIDLRVFQQIVGQVLHNALKFSGESPVAMNCRIDGGQAVFTIADEGKGIRPSELKEVFKPFWKATQDMDRLQLGAGLGLSIAHHYLSLLGGEIRFSKREPQGLQVVVRFGVS